MVNACNKDLEYDFNQVDDKIVIDGQIEQNQSARVILTRNFPFFSEFDSASIRNLILTRAKVSLNYMDKTEVLTLRRDDRFFPPFVYESNEIVGKTDSSYEIIAEFGGKTVSAVTTIPEVVSLDTAYFVAEENDPDRGSVFISFTDPPGKHYYRVFTRHNDSISFTSAGILALSDAFFSEQEFGMYLKKGNTSLLTIAEDNSFYRGDTVTIKFCTIDKAHYDFWNTFQDEALNASNPFAASLKDVTSNIEGDGLGIWGGYGAYYATIVLK